MEKLIVQEMVGLWIRVTVAMAAALPPSSIYFLLLLLLFRSSTHPVSSTTYAGTSSSPQSYAGTPSSERLISFFFHYLYLCCNRGSTQDCAAFFCWSPKFTLATSTSLRTQKRGWMVFWEILDELQQKSRNPVDFCMQNEDISEARLRSNDCDNDQNYLLGAFKPSCNISIAFSDGKTRKQVSLKKENGQMVSIPLFQSQENITGKITVDPLQGKKIDHNGVKIELLGQIEMYFDRGNFYDFTSLVRELDVPGEIYERKTYPFEFSTVEMPYETYNGVNVRLRYVLKVTISRGYAGSIVEYQDFMVRNYSPLPSINNGIKMEVGIEDCLHIEFEYNKSKYHLKDVIIGKIYFLLVRIKIKNMDLEIRRRESTGSGANTHVETETLAKYELMDGAPVRGESIPVRLFLSPYELTPTHRNINNKFSVKYYLNLVLVDEEDR
ncbi:Vacuolar protein sorting-associated protein 26A, partial [Cucurbita argyrosperma subsp. argyrosperma]